MRDVAPRERGGNGKLLEIDGPIVERLSSIVIWIEGYDQTKYWRLRRWCNGGGVRTAGPEVNITERILNARGSQ